MARRRIDGPQDGGVCNEHCPGSFARPRIVSNVTYIPSRYQPNHRWFGQPRRPRGGQHKAGDKSGRRRESRVRCSFPADPLNMCLLVVQFRYKYDRFVLKQMLFPSKPSPDVSHSLRSPHDQPPSPRTDKERSLVSYFLGTLPRRQVILETATKERYLLTPKRADGSSYMAVSDARKVRWAYDISLILEQEVIVEDVKDEPTEPPVISEPTQELLEDSSVVPSALSSKETGKAAEVADKEEGELESSGGGEALPTAVKPQPDKDGDVEMGSGDKEPGELNEDGENAEAPQLTQAGPSSTAPAALTPPAAASGPWPRRGGVPRPRPARRSTPPVPSRCRRSTRCRAG